MAFHFVPAIIESGNYISPYKIAPLLVLLLIWTRLLTWADKDAAAAHLPRVPLNTGMMSGLIVALIAFFYLPGWFVAYPVVLLILAVEIGAYLVIRSKAVGLKDLKGEVNASLRGMIPGGGGKKAVKEVAGAVQLTDRQGNLLPAPDAETPEGVAYAGVQKMLTDPLQNNAEMVEYAATGDGGTVRYSVDGVVYTGTSLSKTLAASSIAYLKAVAGMDIRELRKPQAGLLKVSVNGKRSELQMQTKGSTAGEFMRLLRDPKKRHDFTLETLGMPDDQIQMIRESIAAKAGGIVLLSAPRGQGLTSLAYAMLRAHDAFLQHVITVERDQEQDLEGVTQNKLAAGATAAEELQQVSWVVSQQPDVLLATKPESREGAAELIKSAKEGHRVYVTFVAGNTFETLTAWRKLVGDDKLAMSQLQMVISGRTLRKLCVACKVGYMPDPETLRKLNMDSSHVEKLYQARKEPMRDQKGNVVRCEFCNELRYKGRSGIYEILIVDSDVRQVLMSNGNVAQLRPAFRKQKGRYLQELGLELVEQGETSVQEVLRVLRPPQTAGTGGAAA